MKILIILIQIISLAWALPNELEEKSLGMIVRVDGKAKILSNKSIKKHQAKCSEKLFRGDKLIAYSGAKVLVKLDDNSSLILNERSELVFIDKNNLTHNAGEIYYKIKTRKSSQGLKIKTPFSIMGIKGTEFIVDAKGRGEIALNEGLLGIESLNADFELHKQKLMADFEKFKNEQNSAFEAFKAEAQGETVAYVKEFDLEAGKVLHFLEAENCKEACESRVNEKEMPENFQNRFKMYREMIE